MVVVHLTDRDAGHMRLGGFCLGVSLVHLPFLTGCHPVDQRHWRTAVLAALRARRRSAHTRQFGEFSFFAAASATALSGCAAPDASCRRSCWRSAPCSALSLTGCRGALLSWMLFVLLLAASPGATAHRVARSAGARAQCGTGLVSGPFGPAAFAETLRSRRLKAPGPNFDSGRITMWIDSMKQIAVHPFFGSGPEGYWLSGCCDRAFLQAHNFVLQFLMEFGVDWLRDRGAAAVARTIRHLGGFAGAAIAGDGATTANRVLACMIAAYLAYSLIDQTMYHLLPLLLIAPIAGLVRRRPRAGRRTRHGFDLISIVSLPNADAESLLQRLTKTRLLSWDRRARSRARTRIGRDLPPPSLGTAAAKESPSSAAYWRVDMIQLIRSVRTVMRSVAGSRW